MGEGEGVARGRMKKCTEMENVLLGLDLEGVCTSFQGAKGLV